MTRAIDKLRQGYSATRRPYTLENLGLTLYFTTLTQGDLDAVAQRMTDEAGVDPQHKANASDRNYYLLIHKAQDEDGSPAFQTGDLHYLKNEADYDTMQGVIAFMYAAATKVTDLAEGKGESEPTTGSDGDSISQTTGSAVSST